MNLNLNSYALWLLGHKHGKNGTHHKDCKEVTIFKSSQCLFQKSKGLNTLGTTYNIVQVGVGLEGVPTVVHIRGHVVNWIWERERDKSVDIKCMKTCKAVVHGAKIILVNVTIRCVFSRDRVNMSLV